MEHGKLIGAIAATCLLALATASAVVADDTGAHEIIVGGETTPPAEPPEPAKKWNLYDKLAKRQAKRQGLYGGVGVGAADHEGSGSEAAWRMDVWLRLIDYLSVQIGYTDLNDASNGDVDGITYAGVAHLPIGDIYTLHGKVGGMTATTRNADNTNSSTESKLTWGAGGSVSLPYNLGLRVEWEHYDFKREIDAGWLSLYYQFGVWKRR